MDSQAPSRHQILELLLFGDLQSTAGTALLDERGFAVLDAAHLTARVGQANGVDLDDPAVDLAALRVPMVPDAVWTSMVQAVSKRRAASPRVAVVGVDLGLTLSLWKHLMPGAVAVGPAPAAGSEHALSVEAFASAYPNDIVLVDSWVDLEAAIDQRHGVPA